MQNEINVSPADGSPIGMFRLKTVALLCGAALMGLEMAGVRILEPYLGSTIYVWGSIIGIFLAALSLGYWLGGIMADRHPRVGTLGLLILAAAALVFLIPLAASPLCKELLRTAWMGPRLRALCGAAALYALPSALLGMVSPYAVRLAARNVADLGRTAGSLYAVSTLGSIIGTFLVSFVLVEFIGSLATVWCVGLTLALVSVLCVIDRLRGTNAAAAAAALLFVVLGYAGLARAEESAKHDALWNPPAAGNPAAGVNGGKPDVYLEGGESAYHNIAIIRSGYNQAEHAAVPPGAEAIYMLFNNQIESGALLNTQKPGSPGERFLGTACGYVRMLHLGAVFTGRGPQRVLIIGCGGGIGPQDFLRDYRDTVQRIDVVDIDPRIFELAQKYFGLPASDPVIKNHAEDGRLFLRTAAEKWDYIVLDAYTSGGRIPRHLITREFFDEAREHLTPDGVLVANVISATQRPTDGSTDHSRLYRALCRTLDAVFSGAGGGSVYAFPRHRYGTEAENIIFVATRKRFDFDQDEVRRRFLQLDGSLIKQPGLDEAVQNVKVPLLIDQAKQDGLLLTDDFCPTDSMVNN